MTILSKLNLWLLKTPSVAEIRVFEADRETAMACLNQSLTE